MATSNRSPMIQVAFLVLLAFVLRVLGFGFGLPGPVFADEPHFINLAVSFGSGTLDPQFFKYPSLWMYLLFILFGGLFLAWSGFGMFKSVSDFAHLFVADPALFYLTARGFTAFSGSLGVIFIYRAAFLLLESREAAFLAGVFYAISPPLLYFAHQSKPDTMMLTLSAMAYFFSIRYYKEGKPKDALLAGLVMGLAGSTQYTAVFSTPILLAAHVTRHLKHKKETPLLSPGIIFAFVLIPLFFFLGSPYILIHFKTFLSDLSGLRAYGRGDITSESARAGWRVFYRFASAFGPDTANSLGIPHEMNVALMRYAFIPLILSFGLLFKKKREAFWLLGIPLLLGAFVFSQQNQLAVINNYTFSIFPVLFIASGSLWILARDLTRSRMKKAIFLTGLFCLPTLGISLYYDLNFLKEDTRVSAKKWIETHIPLGSKILMDQTHAGPYLVPTKEQIIRLMEKTKVANPQRSQYFKLFLESHPGGGYEIYIIQRTPAELISPIKRQTELAQKAVEWIDVENGLENVRKAGVDTIVWSGKGATRSNSPRLLKFFDQLEAEGTPIAKFVPGDDYFSPLIKIYSLKKSQPSATR